ncbi:MAG: PssD/Cps14F family polysaccharide biosynthesis glycosyltransferase [Candidatus Diapherotrites archaeon]
MKICLAASAGGHLTELLQLKSAWRGKEHFYLTDKRANGLALAKMERVYFVECPRRNPFRLLINILQSLLVFIKEKPDFVISTGADTAVPFCLIVRLFGKKVAFIESFCRIKEPSLSGRIMYRFASLFLVQWKENLEFFPKAEFCGSVF